MLHLLADREFDLTKATKGGIILLHTRTPEKTGFLTPAQIQSDIGKHTLPGDAENDLRKQNTSARAKRDSYEGIEAFYTNCTFAAGIVVTNLTGMRQERFFDFEKEYPHARGWVESYLPGYTDDGSQSVVRAMVGPWAHAASLTAVLKKSGTKWVVKWYHIARYA